MTSLMARVLSVAIAVIVASTVAGASAHAQEVTPEQQAERAEQVEKAARRVLDSSYQDDREPAKVDENKQPRKRPKRVERDTPTARQRIRDEETRQGGGPISSLASMLMWGVVIAGVIIIAIFIARDLFKYSDDPGAEHVKEGPVEIEEIRAALDKPLDDADQLAAAGRYAEAIHTLLLRTFQELARTSAVKIAASMTSREILARIPLLGDSRDALADLVMMVELTWFGDDVPGQAEWERCRSQFHRFVAAYQQRAPGAPGRAPLPAGSHA
jgi:hypothetical protein